MAARTLGEGYVSTTSGRTEPYWFAGQAPVHRLALDSDLDVDVAVVGAGLAGLLCAYRLAVAGTRLALLEDRSIGSGESGRTTAHFTNALDDRYHLLEKMHGRARTRHAAASHTAAIEEIARIVREERIACDLERVDGYLFLHPSDEEKTLDREQAACRRAGLIVERLEETPGLEGEGPCIRFPNQVQLHPTKLMAGLVRRIEREGGAVHTSSRVEEAKEGGLTCNGHTVRARHVLACTNVPFHERVAMHLKQAPYRTYVIASPVPAGTVRKALWWDTGDQESKAVAPPYHYVRLHGDTLVVGGEDHKTGHPQRGDPFARLEEWARARFPLKSVSHAWSGQVVEPFDHLAYIGRDVKDGDRRGIVTGDSGNGMTHAVIAGIVLAAGARGEAPPTWASPYAPGRKTKHMLVPYLKETVGDGAAKLADYLRPSGRPARLAPGEGMVRRGPSPQALYRDMKGEVHACSAVCPHLGCMVRWNKVEGSFDCPCHGSRFSPTGQKMNGPADTDLKASEARKDAKAERRAPPARARTGAR